MELGAVGLKPFVETKTRMLQLAKGEKGLRIWLLISTQYTNVTDRQIDGQTDIA